MEIEFVKDYGHDKFLGIKDNIYAIEYNILLLSTYFCHFVSI